MLSDSDILLVNNTGNTMDRKCNYCILRKTETVKKRILVIQKIFLGQTLRKEDPENSPHRGHRKAKNKILKKNMSNSKQHT